MAWHETDVLVAGGGPAGLATAAAFGAAGFAVVCVEPRPPGVEGEQDRRSTAVLRPAAAFLDRAGLWDRLAPHATALQVLRAVDASGRDGHPRVIRDFDAAELGEGPFGWNLSSAAIRAALEAAVAECRAVDFRAGTAAERVTTRDRAALVRLSDGTDIAARLLVAADGRDSPVREALGIPVRTYRYGQKALAFAVTHPRPHGNVSTEIYRSGGPFTLIPLPDRDGSPASAVVWMERGAEAERLRGLRTDRFEAEMTHRSCRLFGPLMLASERSLWPVTTQIATRFHARRTALIAEAAHAVPPIGAQGLNMSLADAAALLSLGREASGALGSDAMLARYERARRRETEGRVAGIDAFNRLAMTGGAATGTVRSAGLAALHFAAPVRGRLMRAGLG